MFVFWKIWRTLLSCYLRFEIRPFDLLPTSLLSSVDAVRKRQWLSSWLEKASLN